MTPSAVAPENTNMMLLLTQVCYSLCKYAEINIIVTLYILKGIDHPKIRKLKKVSTDFVRTIKVNGVNF